MNEQGVVKPMRLWQSLLFFLIPALYGVFAQYALWPAVVRLGLSEENAWYTAHLTTFFGLLAATIVALRAEGWPLRWGSIVKRLRLERMDAKAWLWTLGFTLLFLLAGLLLNMAGMYVYERLGFWPPDADLPLTNIPYYLVVLAFNVITEELWWRGYILPRQELAHAKYAWIVNGMLWPFFHLYKWWAVPLMLLKEWMIPFVSQRTKSTTPALVIHFVSNGVGVLPAILLLLTA
jgi:hypothetical protein